MVLAVNAAVVVAVFSVKGDGAVAVAVAVAVVAHGDCGSRNGNGSSVSLSPHDSGTANTVADVVFADSSVRVCVCVVMVT